MKELSWVHSAHLQLRTFILSFGPDVSLTAHGTHFIFHRKTSFLTMVVTNDQIQLGFVIPRMIFTPRFVSKQMLCEQPITHYTSIDNFSELNQELFTWLRSAYELNDPPSCL